MHPWMSQLCQLNTGTVDLAKSYCPTVGYSYKNAHLHPIAPCHTDYLNANNVVSQNLLKSMSFVLSPEKDIGKRYGSQNI